VPEQVVLRADVVGQLVDGDPADRAGASAHGASSPASRGASVRPAGQPA
jgi:hypothetical protein